MIETFVLKFISRASSEGREVIDWTRRKSEYHETKLPVRPWQSLSHCRISSGFAASAVRHINYKWPWSHFCCLNMYITSLNSSRPFFVIEAYHYTNRLTFCAKWRVWVQVKLRHLGNAVEKVHTVCWMYCAVLISLTLWKILYNNVGSERIT